MGYRSTLTSNAYKADIPEWFKEKYGKFIEVNGTLLNSKEEWKFYDGNELFEDFRKALHESGFWNDVSFAIHCAVLAEDGAITRIDVHPDRVEYTLLMERMEMEGCWNQG